MGKKWAGAGKVEGGWGEEERKRRGREEGEWQRERNKKMHNLKMGNKEVEKSIIGYS